MSLNKSAPVLAIGIDAAQPTVLREMIEQDEMPTLRLLLSEGRWINVESSGIGGSTVWPSFVTGEEPASHGIYAEWCWEPATMSLSRFTGCHLKPFWKPLADAGITVGIMAVPFMPFLGLKEGFEVSEWGPFLLLDGSRQTSQAGAAKLVTRDTGIEPLGPDDYVNLQRLTSACLEGVRERGTLATRLLTETQPDFALVVFTETHRSGHSLWHTVEPHHEFYSDDRFRHLRLFKPTLKNVFEEVDRQIGRLVNAVAKDATVLVFSLHGMRPARGTPAFLAPLLCEAGFARPATWGDLSWLERSIALLSVLKRHTPIGLKRLYYKSMPPATVLRVARPTMLPRYDWSRTRAFSLPTEQNGYIRINLMGREVKGIVAVKGYAETCREVEQWLRSLTSEDGRPLVREVIRTADRAGHASQRLPDLVVRWEDAAYASPLRIKGHALEFHPEVQRLVSQHTSDGFCLLRDGHDRELESVLAPKDMGALLTRLLSDRP